MDPPIKYLALGDSYTIGQGVGPEERWPAQLQRELIMEGFNVDSLKVIAQTGWRTDNLLNAIGEETLLNYDMVSLGYCKNDSLSAFK